MLFSLQCICHEEFPLVWILPTVSPWWFLTCFSALCISCKLAFGSRGSSRFKFAVFGKTTSEACFWSTFPTRHDTLWFLILGGQQPVAPHGPDPLIHEGLQSGCSPVLSLLHPLAEMFLLYVWAPGDTVWLGQVEQMLHPFPLFTVFYHPLSCPLIFFIFYFYLFLPVLGLCCCARAFSSCSERGLLFDVVRGLLTAVASLVAEHGL